MTPAPTNSFLQRLIGAVSLDAAMQGLIGVLLSSLSAGIGARGLGGSSPANIAFITIIALMAWAAWALVTLQVGGALLPEPQTKVDVGELLRTTGFATAPGILRLFGVLPGVTIPVFVLCAVWMLAAMIVAVRQALDYTSPRRAIIACVNGWAPAIGLALAVGLLFGPTVV